MIWFFFLQLGVGLPACAALVPVRRVGKGFHLLNGGIGAAALAVAWWMGGGATPEGTSRLLFLAACLFLAAWLGGQFTPLRERAGYLLLPGTAAGAALLLILAAASGPAAGRPALGLVYGADALLGALLLGSVLAAMNLGHWYLVIPGLPISILKRLTLAFAGSLAGRIVLMGTVSYLAWSGSLPLPEGFLPGHGIFLAQRILFGFAVPILLSVMIWKTVAIRSTQSATGILYVAVFFILMGELISTHLRAISGIPF